jgi:hypothetical protein
VTRPTEQRPHPVLTTLAPIRTSIEYARAAAAGGDTTAAALHCEEALDRIAWWFKQLGRDDNES